MNDGSKGEGPFWVPANEVLSIHEHVVATYGGTWGLRSRGLFDQAISRPERIRFYEQIEDIPRLAACYAASIISMHPFLDGNQRTGWGTTVLFAKYNGWDISCDHRSSYEMVRGLAAGRLKETHLVAFLRRHARRS